jgi:nucleoside-triphosphatase THEP1
VIGVIVFVYCLIVFTWWCQSTLGDAIRRIRDQAVAERGRLIKSEQVVLQMTEDFGYLLRIAFLPGEIEALIHTGMRPDDLETRIRRACAEVDGVVIGTRTVNDVDEAVVLPTALRTRHLYVIGETGSGKTTFLVHLAEEDCVAGNGFIFITPESETIHEIIGRVPRSRIDDVTVLNPADGCTIPLNPFHVEPGEDIDLVTDETTEAFRQLFADTDAAPRTHAILRATVHALLHTPGSTLLDVGRLLDRKDGSFRQRVAASLPEEHSRHFWEEIYPAYPKDAHLPILTRFGRLLGPHAIRSMLCAPGRSFDFGSAMNGGGIVLCALSDGLLGPETARLLGQLVIMRVQLAAMRRAELAPSARRLSTLVIDELGAFTSASQAFETLLSRSRKYGLALIAAHQATAQLPERTLKMLLGNVGTIIAFRVGASDARLLARELTVSDEKLSATAFASLGVGEAIARIDRTMFRMRTLRPQMRGDAGVWVRVRDRSRARSARVTASAPKRRQPLAPKRPLDGFDPADPFGGGS